MFCVAIVRAETLESTSLYYMTSEVMDTVSASIEY